jgi:hypothetical protein
MRQVLSGVVRPVTGPHSSGSGAYRRGRRALARSLKGGVPPPDTAGSLSPRVTQETPSRRALLAGSHRKSCLTARLRPHGSAAAVLSSINIAPPSAADASNDRSACRSSPCPVTAPSPRRHRGADQAATDVIGGGSARRRRRRAGLQALKKDECLDLLVPSRSRGDRRVTAVG